MPRLDRVIRRLARADSVAITGCVIGLFSLLLGWLTLKPNRLAAGTPLKLWETSEWSVTAIILGLWLFCLIIALFGKQRWQIVILGVSLNMIFIITLVLSGGTTTRLLESAEPFARVSLGAGVWLTSFGAYVAIFSCRQRLRSSLFWQNLVSWSGLAVVVIFLLSGGLNNLSVVREFLVQQSRFRQELGNHIIIFSSSVIAGSVIGIPLGIWATRNRHAARPIFFISNILQTVPSLALFGLLIAPLSGLSSAFPVLREWGISGIGAAPAILALVLYSLLPIVRNTYVSLTQLDPAIIDAGRGMGMSQYQVFRRIEVPLSAPLVLEGVRTASVQAVGNTAVAALIGAGGLGWFIFQGIAQAANDMVILGAIPIIGLALIVDGIMRLAVRTATPQGLRVR
ncbi:MAG: ABC transporter permease [Chloroflexi bacterium]|nr:ABC transporter permease [Chloroflexota bacterium]